MYNTNDISAIKEFMLSHNQTVAVAESVTSGHLQAALSLAASASGFFQGGITTYNLGQKARHLHIDPIHATTCNSVSQTVSDEMARHATTLFSSDWSIAITGYASPFPDLHIEQLFAFYSIAFSGEIVRRGRIDSDNDGPLQVQCYYTNQVLRAFLDTLRGKFEAPVALQTEKAKV